MAKQSQAPKPDAEGKKEPVRLIALSDGLFATVFTLLVLDLKIPEALNSHGGNVVADIKWLGPHFFSYLLTFLVAATYWLAHHRNFDHVNGYDRGLLGYNLLFLLFIGLLPFSTAALSSGNLSGSTFRFFWCIYSANMVLAGGMLGLTWAYGVSHHFLTDDTSVQQIRNITIRLIATPAVFLLSFLLTSLPTYISLGPLILLLIPVITAWVDWKYPEIDPRQRTPRERRADRLWRLGRILPWLFIMGLSIWALVYSFQP